MEIDLGRVLDSLPSMVWTALPDGQIDFVNRRWSEYTGLGQGEANGQAWQAVVAPDDLPQLLERWQSILASGEPGEMETRFRRVDGQYHWFVVHCSPMRNDLGRIVKWYGINTDIDERKRAEEARRQSEARLAAAERDLRMTIDTIPVFVATYRPDGTRSFVNRTWQEYMGVPLEEATGTEAATFPHFHPDDIERNDGAWRAALASGEPLTIEVRVRRADGQYRWHTSRRVPLHDEQGNIVRWYSVGFDIDDQKRAEQALLASEREARLIVDSIPGGIEVLTPTGEVEALNDHVVRYFGKTAEELKRQGLTDLIHPEDLQRVLATSLHSTTTGEPYEAEQRFRGADGNYRWFQVRGLPLRDADGRILRWYALHIDIDEKKRAEEALTASERDLKLVVDTILALTWSARPDGSADFLSQHYLDYVGLPAEQALGWGWTAAVHPDDMGGLATTWQAILASGMPGEAEARLRRHDGEYRWFLFRANPLRDEKGNIVRWYGINADIEDRKRAEQALIDSERHARLIVDSIPGMIVTFTPTGKVEFVSQQVLEYFGGSSGDQDLWASNGNVHPDDMQRAVDVFTRSIVSGDPFEVEVQARRHDGVYRWFQSRGSPLRDGSGRIVRWHNLLIDIDEKKRAEEALRASERNFKLTVDTIPVLAWSALPDGTADFFNQHYLEYVGLSAGQSEYWDLTAAIHPDDLDGLNARLQAILASGEPGEAEARLRRFDREYRWFLFRANPLRDEAGNIVRWYGTNTDIDDRKRAEEALRRSEAFLAEGQHLARMGNFSWRIATGDIVWSEQLRRIFEFQSDVPVTLDLIASRVHPEDRNLLADMTERAQRGDSDYEYQHRILLPDGSVKYLHLIAHRVGDHPGETEYIGAVLDVTQRRLAEEALGKARSELAHVARVTSLGALTASIAHEVNQPLSGIVTNASTCLRMLAADPPNVEGARETARRTIRDGNRAAEVIARLRALFSKGTAAIEPVDLNEAVREVIALSWTDLQRSRIVLRTEFADALPPVAGDRVQLQQVIMNLLRNAADAMGGIDDRPRLLLVRTELDRGDDHVRLSVQDAGVGLGAENTERLFQAFYTTKSDGMGIGLAVSRSIIESHNGRLWAAPNDGPGATFAFSVPWHSGDDIARQDTGAARVAVGGGIQSAAGFS